MKRVPAATGCLGHGQFFTILIGVVCLLVSFAAAGEDHGHDAEAEHGHDPKPAAAEAAEHEDHADGDNDHAEHGDEVVVHLSARGRELAGIRIARAARADVGRSVMLPGEVGFNEDRRVHVTPRYGGIIREMRGTLGARVAQDEVLAVVESNDNLTTYEVRAPLAGRIVTRTGAVGAYAPEETALFVVADLSTVWVDLAVYPRHLDDVREGARALVRSVGTPRTAVGTISYVAPVFDRDRRVATARIVLANPDGRWRPGMFVRAELDAGGGSRVTAVEREAVQLLGEQTVVFVPAGDSAYRAVPVTTGASGATHTEIRSGLALGDDYVAAGAFALKAEAVTSTLGSHAGHGH
ncbi:efflux RND transporter periplasmic adaptor subunit [candidate division WOR-3 bacterium]|nr:efflux RND transporter periplasmic adaptor subunit [candidate division WOR-3 bacterium]